MGRSRILLNTILVLGLLAACGPTPTPEVIRETVVVKEEVEVTRVVEVEKEVVVTATPEPMASSATRVCAQTEKFWSQTAPGGAITHQVKLNSYADDLYRWIGTYQTTKFSYVVHNLIAPTGVTIDKVVIAFGVVVTPKTQTVLSGFAASWVTPSGGTTTVTYTAAPGTGISVGSSGEFAFTCIDGDPSATDRSAVRVIWSRVITSGSLRACVPRKSCG